MKKLSLKKLNLGASDLLQRNQLKTILGGDGGYTGGGGVYCRCLGGIGGEGHVASCSSCAILCQLGNGYICVG